MPDASTPTVANPPVDLAVAVWLGMADAEIAKGLREGWIRGAESAPRAWVEERVLAVDARSIPQPPAPGETAASTSIDDASDDVRIRLQSIMQRLDRSLTSATFERAWETSGADDAARATQLAGLLATTLGVANVPTTEVGATLDALAIEAELASGNARLVELPALRASELESLARESGLVRRALVDHASWAFAGDAGLARRADANGRFDRFDRDTGETLLSDDWIGDRARHAAWRSAAASGDSLAVAGTSWRFVDREAGDQATIELTGSEGGAVHQVIFARDDGDRINGADGTDRIHGGDGDDVLRGRAGDDLLEGAAGDDLLQGGGGHDVIAGQQGDDELEGGAGDDHLQGGGGNDELAGGAGDDRLVGGSGNDLYRVESGGGEDVIEDDGGAILLDDVAVEGTMAADGDGWVSADGRVRFSREGDADSTLVMRVQADSSSAQASVVRLQTWQQGAYGITLASSDAPESAADALVPDGVAPVADAASADVDPFDEAMFDPSTLVDVGHIEALQAPAAPDANTGLAGHSDASAVTLGDVALALSEGLADDAEVAAAWTLESPFARPLVPPQPLMPPEPFGLRAGA